MKKIFRLANAEFHKIFYRPSIFILTALLIITLVLTNLLYSPTPNTTKLMYEGKNNVGQVYTTFVGTSKTETTKQSILDDLNKRFAAVQEEYDSLTKKDKLKELQDKISSLKAGLTVTLQDELIKVNKYTEAEFNAKKKTEIDVLKNLKNQTKDLLDFLYEVERQPLNFYITYNQYDRVVKNVKTVYDAFPANFDDFRRGDFISFAKTLIDNYSLDASEVVLSEVQKDPIVIKEETYNEIVKKYNTDALAVLESYYFDKIHKFYDEKSSSTAESDIASINELIANYYSFAQMNIKVLESKFLLLKINQKTDTQIKDLVGYNELSKYSINEEIQIYNYLIENNKFDYNYLTSFNFNQASGATSNAYDYTVYAMQILSILIIVFSTFYACSSIAGDQSSGTMKMIAIRPYTRTKLFSGKFLSCLMFGILLMLVSFVASFVVGAVSFGIPMSECLVVFDATTILTLNPFVMLLIYFLSLVANLLFYISLAMLICLLCKSNTLSVFLTNVVVAAQVILNGVVDKIWLKYTIFGHFDLFKYFGNSKFGFLSMNILPDSNFMTSALVLGFGIVLINILSYFLFKRKDIA